MYDISVLLRILDTCIIYILSTDITTCVLKRSLIENYQ